MDEAKRQEITKLAADKHDKKLRYESLSLMNVCGLSPEDARQSSVNYEIARAEYLEACAALDAAMIFRVPMLDGWGRQQDEELKKPTTIGNGSAFYFNEHI